ncbi:MAG: type II toxin-antitoxin system RelE/ParE family toxin [Flavobacteriaceae bacterium]
MRKISPPEVLKIIKKVESLTQNPRPEGSVKLTGSEKTYRVRVGDYRILYEILEDRLIVEVCKVGHRREIYRG